MDASIIWARARDYDRWFETAWGRHAWTVQRRAVEAALPDLVGLTVLDVGCGTGRLVHFLSERGAQAFGVDLAAEMLVIGAGRAPGRLIRADARRLPFADASVDSAVSVATLEFTDAAAVLAEMARVTRPGGRIVVLTLNPASIWGLVDRPTRAEPYASGRFFNRTELRRMGRIHGQTRVKSHLFTAARPGFLHHFEPVAALLGRIVPRLGAVQVLTIERTP